MREITIAADLIHNKYSAINRFRTIVEEEMTGQLFTRLYRMRRSWWDYQPENTLIAPNFPKR